MLYDVDGVFAQISDSIIRIYGLKIFVSQLLRTVSI